MLYELLNINILNSNILLDIIGILTIISSILIILVSNPMYSILYLIILFINVAIYLYLIGISIMSLLYILVYIGAIAILFLFILSLFTISPSYDNIIIKNNIPNKNIPFILIIILILYNNIINYYNNIYIINNNNNNNNNNLINNNNWELINNNWYLIFDINHLNQIGFLLYTEYSILFILLSFLLLFSIISAIILTHNK